MACWMRPKSIRLPERLGWGGRMFVVNTLNDVKPAWMASGIASKTFSSRAPARTTWNE